VARPQARLLEAFARRRPLAAVKHAGRAVLLDAVTFDVPQVPGGGLGAVTSEPLQVGFDDDAAGVGPRAEASGRSERDGAAGTAPSVTAPHERRDPKGA
jgi:hypothetical protein